MMNLGPRIKKFRTQKKISLTELSKESGVQIATLSRIEHGQMTGTLESHINISKALGIELIELYQDLDSETTPTPSGENTANEVIQANQSSSYEILAKQLGTKRMLPRLLRIEPKGVTEETTLPNGSEIFIFLLEGKITVRLKAQMVMLSAGSSFYFNAAQPHLFINDDVTTAKILVVTTPVIL
jgi:transcriptional regulator with XRE-family HTH domain